MRSVVGVLLLAAFAAGGDLTDAAAAKWLRYVVPKKQEQRWCDIPWRATLWTAVVEAHREKKPILLWAMNGHPLACT